MTSHQQGEGVIWFCYGNYKDANNIPIFSLTEEEGGQFWVKIVWRHLWMIPYLRQLLNNMLWRDVCTAMYHRHVGGPQLLEAVIQQQALSTALRANQQKWMLGWRPGEKKIKTFLVCIGFKKSLSKTSQKSEMKNLWFKNQ